MRKLPQLAGVVLLGLLSALLAPAPAHAAVDITCKVSNHVAFSPGLVMMERPTNVTIHTSYSDCISPEHPTITSGSHSNRFHGLRACFSVPDTHSTTINITWNTGDTSTVVGTATAVDAVGGATVHTITGTVTAGVFVNSMFTEIITQVNPLPTQCVGSGVTSQDGTGTVTIE